MAINHLNDAINIYLIQPDFGRADGIPGNSLVIGGSFVLTSVLSHEIGHCLGLYHTHRGTVTESGNGPSQCSELVNGSNGTTCGDYVDDTPADPNRWSGCTYIGSGLDANGQAYNPLNTNIMSYVSPNCLTQLTLGQKDRIHASIEGSNILLATLSNPTISGPDNFCNVATYTISNLPAGATVTWEASPSFVNLTLLNPEGTSVQATKVNSLSGSIVATIQTGCGNMILTKSIIVGAPDADYTFGTVSNSNGNHILSSLNCLVENSNPNYPNMYSSDVSVANSAASTYQWTLVSKAPSTAIAQVLDWGNGNATINIKPLGATLTAKLTISNSCGTTNTDYTFATRFCEPIEEMFVYYPNPSSKELKIAYKKAISTANMLLINNPFSVKLLNEKGKVLKEGKTKIEDNEIALQVADIPNGIYYLHIYEGKNVSKQKIVIAH